MKKYKIYAKGNYIVIVDVLKNEYFYGIRKEVHVDKSNVNKEVYRAFNVKDFSDAINLQIPNILKEDNTAYSEEEFDTFYQENTGNFNGGGTAPTGGVESVTGDSVDNTDPLNPIINAIPLSGTTAGNPVSGDIEFDENERAITSTQDSVKYSISPYNGGLGNFTLGANISAISDLIIACINATASGNSMSFVNVLNGNFSELSQSSEDGIAITSTSPSAYGIRGLIDFTPNITDLDYVQKKYVDERGSVFNATTAVLSASDLNTAYPNAKDGFSVIAPNVIGGGKYYIKAGAGWVYQQILAVV